jgi:hypothetical protein
VPLLHAALAEFGDRVQLLAVYISEAHAADEWPVGKKISCVNQPQTIEERIELAKRFVAKHKYKIPMLVDSMDNSFQSIFSPWPYRYYAIRDGRVIFKAQPDPERCGYPFDRLLQLIKELAA